VRARRGRRGPRHQRLHARLLPLRAGSLRRGHGHAAAARHAQEPQAPAAPRALPRRARQALLPARHRAARAAVPAEARVMSRVASLGDVYLTRAELAARIDELGAEIARDYDGLVPVLVPPLKSSPVFLADLSRALKITHELDVVELAAYAGGLGGGVRLLKDVEKALRGRQRPGG